MTQDTPNKLIRKRNKFFRENGALFETHPSISKARRRSRLLQAAGVVISVDKSDDPKPPKRRDRGDAADRFIAQAIRKEQEERVKQKQENKYGQKF